MARTVDLRQPLPERAVQDRQRTSADATDLPAARTTSSASATGSEQASIRRRRDRPAAAPATWSTSSTRSSTSSTAAAEPLRDRQRLGRHVMGYYDTTQLPIYKYLHGNGAPKYVIADHFFQAAFGGSFLNHQYLIAAAAAGLQWHALRARADGMPRSLDAAGSPFATLSALSLPSSTSSTATRRSRAASHDGRRTRVRRLRRQHAQPVVPANGHFARQDAADRRHARR